ncbi:MAG: Rieske (2Fe-2S) protein [Gammaproteobacteria bacterium]|nr:Rieske (2Fe-2S) protein [Gammaproteobacteria bacterium]
MADSTQKRLCRLDEVAEGSSRGLTASCAGRLYDVFVVRKHGELYAYLNRCPHTGGPLDWVPDQFLSLDRQHIQCATHAALFRIDDGFCVAGPCGGQSLARLPVTIKDGEVYLDEQKFCAEGD